MRTPIITNRKTITINGNQWVAIGYKARLAPDQFNELNQLLFNEFNAKYIDETKTMLLPMKQYVAAQAWFKEPSTEMTYPYFYLDDSEHDAFVQATLDLGE